MTNNMEQEITMRKIDTYLPARDRFGRPLVDGKPWTRTSTLAKALDDTSNLIAWKARTAVEGLASSPDLISLAATAQGDKRTLNDIVERAVDRAGGTSGRDTGTAIHAASELLDYGEPTGHLPKDLLADALAYQQACRDRGLTPVAAEQFVAHRGLQCAGSFDRLLVDRDGTAYIGDLKTGNSTDPNYPARWSSLAYSIQCAVYASAQPYRDRFLTWSDLDLPTPNLERAFIFYLPRGTGTCHVLEIDIAAGLRAAQTAVAVRDFRKTRPVLAIYEGGAA